MPLKNSSTPSSMMRMAYPKSSDMQVSAKIGNPVQSLESACALSIIWALSRAKSFLVKTVHKKLQLLFHTLLTKKDRDTKKLYFGSHRFHYNWCSSSSFHVQPFPAPNLDGLSTSHIYYYDPTRNSVISVEPAEDGTGGSLQLSKYLAWLEEKCHGEEELNNDPDVLEGCSDEIDKLADVFIAKCHQMFILEKQESYRRFQEMIAA
ncbi:hypothetical protein SAY86_014946 [Trapa natans]|uniref:Uncharacterized protein n=1 Tax=Trapa natans TaxID=22666 RepID=A0AAN7KN95_TRANT|nr:hypothetical protein SAY86_014946 [Trapa natans]